MTDNTPLNPGTGGDSVRDIDKTGTGIKTQVMVLDAGGGGAENLVSANNGLPVNVNGTDTAGATHRILTDTKGVLQVNEIGTDEQGYDDSSLLRLILVELRVIGFYLRELPGLLSQNTLTTTAIPPQFADQPDVLRNDEAGML